MTRKLLFAAFILALTLTFVAARHQLTNASPNVAPPPQHAPPLEQVAALASGEPNWQVVAGGGGKYVKLYDVDMATPDDGWAVGSANPSSYGVIMHYTNTMWSRVSVPDGTYAVGGVSMLNSNEGWAALWMACSYGCDMGALMHYTTASGWQTTTLPAKPGGYEWGTAFNDMDIKGDAGWVVGYDSHWLQFDGVNWTPMPAPTYSSYAVSVVDANEAWAVGSSPSGTLAHFSGGSWSLVTPTLTLPGSYPSVYLRSIHMLTTSEGWVVGFIRSGTSPNYSYQCLMLHYNGSDWSQVGCPSGASGALLYSVHMRSSNDVWAVGSGPAVESGGVALHYNGSTWTQVAVPPGTPRLQSVKLVGTNDGWAVGRGGTILRLVSGNWTRAQGPSRTVGPVDSVNANEAWFGGDAGQLYRWQNGTIVTYTSPLTTPITALDMVSPTLGWAASTQPAPHVLRYSEGTWTTWPFSSRVTAISMISPDEGWFALRDSPWGFMHYHSGVWEAQYGHSVNSVSMLNSSSGWATGFVGWGTAWKQVYKYSSGTWSTVSPALNPTGSGGSLKVIGINSSEAWVAGYSIVCAPEGCPVYPQLYRFSGGTWISGTTTGWLAFFDISKVSATEWWAAGKRTTGEYAFLHYKDGTYTTVPAAGEDVIGISVLPDGSGFARGVGSLLKLLQHQVYLPVVMKQ